MARDLRRYARQTNVRLFVGFFLLLFLVGDGLILAFYGNEAALMGLFCLLGGAATLGMIALIFVGIDWIVRNRD